MWVGECDRDQSREVSKEKIPLVPTQQDEPVLWK